LTHLFIRTIHFKKNSKVDFTLDKKIAKSLITGICGGAGTEKPEFSGGNFEHNDVFRTLMLEHMQGI